MANAVGLNYSTLFKNFDISAGKRSTTSKNSAEKNSVAQYDGNYSVELSENGLNALAQLQKNSVEDSDKKNVRVDEKNLSTKAQDFLEKLRDKYGDYDFIIADNVDDPQSLTADSTKGYSVILSSEEIEKMAEDEDYADKIMGHVDKAVRVIDDLYEEGLGEGVNFASITAAIDEEGNMKLFASIEKMTEEQQERFEKLKEKRAEEKEKAETDETEKDEPVTISAKIANVEADSAEELLSKIFEIDWDKIDEEEFTF